MSWPSSNFHHDSHEWIGRPVRMWDFEGFSFNSRTNINVNINGPSSTAVRQAGTMNMIGGIFNGLANLGAAFIMAKSGNTGFTPGAGGIFNQGYGGGFGGGFGTGLGGGFFGGSIFGGYNNGYSAGGPMLVNAPYTQYLPYSVGVNPNGPAQGNGNGDSSKVDNGKKDDGSKVDDGKKDDGSKVDDGKKDDGSKVDDGKKDDGSKVDDGKKDDGSKVDDGKKDDDGKGAGDKGKPTTLTANQFNAAIDDRLNKDGSIATGTAIGSGDITHFADAYNTKKTGLQHTTSQAGKTDGIRFGTARDKNKNEKTTDGYYKYITVTDQTSGNEWTFEYVSVNSQGQPTYKFKPSLSDLSKDNTSKPGGKDWEATGDEPDYVVTVDPTTNKIKMESSNSYYGATTKGR